MGFFSSSKDKALEAASWAALPIKKVARVGAEKYYRKKGKWIQGECVVCGNPISAKKKGFAHRKCYNQAVQEVSKWQSSMDVNNTLYYPNCNHNRNSIGVDHHRQICNKGE